VEKFDQKCVFEQKCARKAWEYCNDWDSNQVFRLVPSVLHLSAAKSKEFCFYILKKMTKFGRAEGNLALQLEKKYYKTF
jgi:hypothetical protein